MNARWAWASVWGVAVSMGGCEGTPPTEAAPAAEAPHVTFAQAASASDVDARDDGFALLVSADDIWVETSTDPTRRVDTASSPQTQGVLDSLARAAFPSVLGTSIPRSVIARLDIDRNTRGERIRRIFTTLRTLKFREVVVALRHADGHTVYARATLDSPFDDVRCEDPLQVEIAAPGQPKVAMGDTLRTEIEASTCVQIKLADAATQADFARVFEYAASDDGKRTIIVHSPVLDERTSESAYQRARGWSMTTSPTSPHGPPL